MPRTTKENAQLPKRQPSKLPQKKSLIKQRQTQKSTDIYVHLSYHIPRKLSSEARRTFFAAIRHPRRHSAAV